MKEASEGMRLREMFIILNFRGCIFQNFKPCNNWQGSGTTSAPNLTSKLHFLAIAALLVNPSALVDVITHLRPRETLARLNFHTWGCSACHHSIPCRIIFWKMEGKTWRLLFTSKFKYLGYQSDLWARIGQLLLGTMRASGNPKVQVQVPFWSANLSGFRTFALPVELRSRLGEKCIKFYPFKVKEKF